MTPKREHSCKLRVVRQVRPEKKRTLAEVVNCQPDTRLGFEDKHQDEAAEYVRQLIFRVFVFSINYFVYVHLKFPITVIFALA